MQEVQHLFPDFGDQFGSDLRVAKFVFGLRLKHRFLQTDGDGPHHAFADVIAIILAFGILVDGLQEPLAESAEVGATIRGVLPVDKREEGLTGASLAVGEAEFQCLGAEIEGRVDGIFFHFFLDQIQKAFSGIKGFSVVDQLQAGVEIAVVLEAFFDQLLA